LIRIAWVPDYKHRGTSGTGTDLGATQWADILPAL
jgi:hypothetical protein